MGPAGFQGPFTVYVVGGDPGEKHRITEVAVSLGYTSCTCSSVDELRATFEPGRPGCVILASRHADDDGVALQQELRDTHSPCPAFLFVADSADVKTAVQAMRDGAVDFLIKPVAPDLLAARIREAEEKAHRERERAEARRKLAPLTERESTVLELIVRGFSTKEIAAEVFRSPKTIEAQRRSIMRKLAVSNLAQMVRVAVSAGTLPVARGHDGPVKAKKKSPPEATPR
jgi:FixJ family two-component response regulator